MKKNGKIEILRFLFCLSILCYHISSDYPERALMLTKHWNFFGEGRIGVEFFFLTTGYLTASKIFRTRDDGVNVFLSTARFIWGKIRVVLPFHVILYTLGVAYRVVLRGQPVMETLSYSWPNIFFLQMTGIPGKNIVNVEWYIASMLMVLLIVYPLCRLFTRAMVYVISPVVGVAGLAYVIYSCGNLWEVKMMLRYTYAGNIRALADICLGIWIFGVFYQIKEIEFSGFARFLATLCEMAGYALVFYYMVSGRFAPADCGIFAILICLLTGLTFSDIPLGGRLFQNKLFYFLGSCSLPVYLSQNLVRAASKQYVAEFLNDRNLVCGIVLTTVLFGMLLQCLSEEAHNAKVRYKIRRKYKGKHLERKDLEALELDYLLLNREDYWDQKKYK